MISKEQIYNDYHNKVLGYLYSATKNPAITEDLCSNVFLKIISKLDSFDESKSSLSTWIYNIARNTLYDYFRTRHEICELSDDIEYEDLDECSSHIEDLEILAQALAILEEDEYNVIYNKYYRQRSLKQIAEELGISYFRVRIIHQSGLKKIEYFFKKY